MRQTAELSCSRSPHQLYVFLSLESAAYPAGINYSAWDNFFNISMTFRQDSDVYMPYGRLVPHTPDMEEDEKRSLEESISADISRKTHLAAWYRIKI